MQGGVASPGKSVTVTLSNGGTFSGTTDANGELKFSYVPPSNATVALLSAICSGCQNTATQTITVESADAPNMCLAGDSSTLVGNPIAPATGEKIETQVDWVDNAAQPLTLSRHYKSYGFGGSLAGLGNYWSHNFAGSISGTATDNSRAVRLGDGTSALFNRADAASPWVGNTVSDQLAVNATGPLFTRASDDSRWQFDAAGALLSITRRNGWAVTLAYANGHISSATNAFGRALLFTYDAQGRLASVTTPDAKVLSYTLDGPSRLTGVLYPDGKSKSYVYENSSFANALTGIVDEAGQRFASFAYDFSGRAVSTTHANGAQNYGLSFTSPANGAVGSLQAAPVPANSPLYQASAQVVTPLGGAQTLSFQGGDGQIRLKGSNQAFSGAPFAARAFDYPAAPSLPTLETDFLGVQTMFTWDINRRLPLSTTKAANRPEAQTTSTQWHATLRLPVLVIEPGRSTASTYDALGNKLTETVTDTATGQARATAWSYNAQGLAATRTDPRGFVSTFDYDAVGNLTGFKNPLNQETRFTHDAAGRVLSQTDPSGLATIYAYDVRGRVLSIAQGGTGAATETTSFSYTPTGQVASVAQPSGQAVAYTYDAAQRLVGVADNRGNSITYTLDAMGNRLREEVKDSTGAIALLTTRTVNQLNRLASQSGAAGQTSQFAYDANAEPAGSTDPLNQTTRQSLDALRRPATTTLADNAVAIQAWSALNQISTVTDPKGVATQFTRNAFGEVLSETSPDIGTVAYTRDQGGFVASMTDATGQTTTYARDALGRTISATFADGKVHQFSYDTAGNVSQFADASGSTSYTRDLFGRVLKKTQTVADNPGIPSSYAVQYLYQSGGAVAQINYSSGLKVFYRRNAAGQIIGIDTQKPGSSTVNPFVSGITYTALQQPKAWAWKHCNSATLASCVQANRSFDTDGRMTANELASYTYDAASRITGITQQLAAKRTVFVSGTSGPTTTVHFNTPLSWTVGYDSRDRIISFNRNTSALSRASTAYTYDANSNRLSALIEQISDTDGNGSFTSADITARTAQTSSLASNSNRLLGFSQTLSSVKNGATLSSSTSTTNYTRDAAGNLASDGLRVFEYDAQNRHSKTIVNDPDEGSKITYLHNALGQRVFKSEPQVDHVAPSATALGTPFIDWLKINFGWLFAQAQLDATLGQAYVYDDGQLGSTPMLVGEYGNGGSNSLGRFEYIWLPTDSGHAIPVGLYRSTSLSAVHSDHLGTPRKITNTSNNADWQWPYSAFGENSPNGILTTTNSVTQAYTTDTATATKLAAGPSPISFNLRFAGQYFDDESKLSYNYFRSYQASQGRYTQPDPVGLDGGLNRFGYVGGNPLSRIDPLGLADVVFDRGAGTITVTNGSGSVVGTYPAANNTTASSNGAWPNGTFPFSHYMPLPESGTAGPYGSNGNFVFDVPGRSGMGIHSGRRGPQSPTLGCVRTTDDATDFLRDLHRKDPLRTITVR